MNLFVDFSFLDLNNAKFDMEMLTKYLASLKKQLT